MSVLTGGHGTVGTAITAHSSNSFTLFDREETPPGAEHPQRQNHCETVIADVTDLEAVETAFDGHDAVVHLAGCPDVDASYEEVQRNNAEGTHNVLEAARRADVDTIVFASSNHVVGGYEQEHAPELYDPDYDLTIDHESPIRPDSHYGASKAACEAWGRYYAETYGIQFYALRIGSVRPPEWDHPYGDAERGVEEGRWERGSDRYEREVARLKCTWQSRRDVAHMVDCCLTDDDVTFDVFYGVSDNAVTWFDIDHAHDRIGYSPQDSADDDVWDETYGT